MDVNATCVASLVALAGRCQWKSEPTKDELKMKTRDWALLRIKKMQMPANKILLRYQKLKRDCFVFLHLCSFTYSSFLLLPLFKKIVPLFLCVSLNPAVGGDPVSKIR